MTQVHTDQMFPLLFLCFVYDERDCPVDVESLFLSSTCLFIQLVHASYGMVTIETHLVRTLIHV